MKTSPLDHIKIASPCSADWNEMRGDKRKRFCTDCQLNVYNFSEMTRREAENLLFETEGRICVRLYRRKDGTVITQDCPVGWRAIKQRVSRLATATFGFIIGFFGGIYGYSQFHFDGKKLLEGTAIETEIPEKIKELPVAGEISNPDEINQAKKKPSGNGAIDFSGGISNGPDLMWLFSERYPK